MKFWKTGKIVKAISAADYQKLQKSRGRNDPGLSNIGPSNPGPSSSGLSKPPTLIVSDSDSDGQIIPLVRKRKKIFHIPSPSGSDSDFSPAPHDRTRAGTSMEKMLKDVVNIVQDVKTRMEKAVPDPQERVTLIKEIFTCLICKQVSSESSRPVVPPCCKSIVCCYDCISQWILSSPICPHCRSPITIDECESQPVIKPIFNIITEGDPK